MLFFVFAFILFSPLTHAETSESGDPTLVSGRVFTDHYLYTSTGKLAESSVSTWLTLDYKANSHVTAHVVGALDVFAKRLDDTNSDVFSGHVREAYVSYFSDGLDLRAGQQIIPWGKSDGVNPTDYFTAKNYTFLNPDDEVKRVGAPGVNLAFTPENGSSPLTFQAVFQAYYPQTELLIPSQVIPQGIQVNLYPNSPTPFQGRSMEYGARVSYQKSNYDFSISAFHGFAAIPEYVFNTNTLSVNPINPAENAFGADASFTLGDSIVRFESAVFLPENGGPDDPLFGLVEPDHWDTVVGIERPCFTDFRVQFQFLYRYHLYFKNGPPAATGNPALDQVLSGVAAANATLLNYQHPGNPGATFRLAYEKDGLKWTADVFFVGYFGDGNDYLVRPQVGFKPIDNLKLLAGMDYYGGNPTRPLGALHAQSDGFFEAKYLF